ncbi:sigma-70 family RNA polymerase sigma factor [Duganella sp. FT94W]|uniref:RNA polymerase sigma factor n=1 Tax=Duganella lactea TaxID=2692173 RepID=A0ABW9VA85_9BURK|nr:sigma-70 family RNA polymerase sigma factor [Duganella lactea]MYM35757.1 sigma-70 family RNA polymerase sigma factor [Duganella lactea]
MPILIQSPEHQRLVALLQRVALRDHAAFNQLYALTAPHLYGVAVRVVRRRELADEVLQEAFINVWQHAGSYAAALSTPMTWLISIVRNKSLDHLRRHKPESEALVADDDTWQDNEDAAAPADPLALLTAAVDAQHLGRCLAQLHPAHRQSLALAYYHGLSHSEIARHLQVPVGTAKAWVRRAMERLRQAYQAPPRECRPAMPLGRGH